MKLKYYLRGLAVGIIVTTVILAIVSGHSGKNMSDADVIARAKQLGMVMSNSQTIDKNNLFSTENTEDTEDSTTTENSATTENSQETQGTKDESQQPETGGTDASAEQTQYVELIIAPGEYCRAVSEDLASKGLVSDSESFRKYMFDAKYDELISSGVYQIPVGASYEEIGKILISGNN